MRFLLNSSLMCLLSALLFGCIPSSYVKEDKQLQSIINAYKNQQGILEKKRAAQKGQGIKNLTVKETPEGYVVSADLDRAPISKIVSRIFEETGASYMLDNVVLRGKSTARFSNLTLLKSLNLILGPIVLTAESRDGTIVITSGLSLKTDSGRTHAEVRIYNLDVVTVATLLNGLYPINPATGVRVINFGTVPNTNTVYLNGSKDEVANAIKVLMKADTNIKHVMLEVILIEFSSEDFAQVGSNIADLASHGYSGVNFNFGSFAQDAIQFTHSSKASLVNAYGKTTFTAIIDILISEQKARLISRPFVSTLSGNEANVNITSDQYVIIDNSVAGATITAPSPISSGVVLKITPTVLPDDIIRMNVYVEDSQFGENVANVSVVVDKNSASTVMQVEDGQTFIIGGMVLNRTTWTNSGFPLLRKIPIINAFFAKKSKSNTEREVVIYVTPHIWEPNVMSPLLQEDALKSK